MKHCNTEIEIKSGNSNGKKIEAVLKQEESDGIIRIC